MPQTDRTKVLIQRVFVVVVAVSLLFGSFLFLLQLKKLPFYFFLAFSLLVFRLHSNHSIRIARLLTMLWLSILIFMTLAQFLQVTLDFLHPNDGWILDESHNAQRIMPMNFIWSYLTALILTLLCVRFYRKKRMYFEREEILLVLISVFSMVLLLAWKFV